MLTHDTNPDSGVRGRMSVVKILGFPWTCCLAKHSTFRPLKKKNDVTICKQHWTANNIIRFSSILASQKLIRPFRAKFQEMIVTMMI